MVDEVRFISNEEEQRVLLGVLFDFAHPELGYVVEALLVSHIEDQEDGLAAPVVGAGDGAEPLLARGVPDLELDVLAIDDGGLEAEVDSDGGQVMLLELVLGEADEDGGFAHARVADYDSLVEMVVLLYHRCGYLIIYCKFTMIPDIFI